MIVSGPDLPRAIELSQKIINEAMNIVSTARVRAQPNQKWTQDPKIVGLTILSRSISNFRATLLLVQQDQKLEARAMVRLLYENLLWLAALRERGTKFVQDMLEDEAFNRQALGEWTLKTIGSHGGDVGSAEALSISGYINDLRRKFPKPKKLAANKLGAARTLCADGAVEMAYYEYLRLSLDAVHCSLTALSYHLSREPTQELVLNIVPRTTPNVVVSTVLHACRALLATARGVEELIGGSPASATLTVLEEKLTTMLKSRRQNRAIPRQ